MLLNKIFLAFQDGPVTIFAISEKKPQHSSKSNDRIMLIPVLKQNLPPQKLLNNSLLVKDKKKKQYDIKHRTKPCCCDYSASLTGDTTENGGRS